MEFRLAGATAGSIVHPPRTSAISLNLLTHSFSPYCSPAHSSSSYWASTLNLTLPGRTLLDRFWTVAQSDFAVPRTTAFDSTRLLRHLSMSLVETTLPHPIGMDLDIHILMPGSESTTPQAANSGDNHSTVVASPTVTEAPVFPTKLEGTAVTSNASGSQHDGEYLHIGNTHGADGCPACAHLGGSPKRRSKKESWVACEGCETWYHWTCVSGGSDLALVDKWCVLPHEDSVAPSTLNSCAQILPFPRYCKPCLQKHPTLAVTFKLPIRKSSRKRVPPPYLAASSEPSSSSGLNKWIKIIESKTIVPDRFRRMAGSEVTKEWLQSDDDAFREPVVIEKPEGLGMRMPGWKEGEEGAGLGEGHSFDVDDVCRIVGGETPVEVIGTRHVNGLSQQS